MTRRVVAIAFIVVGLALVAVRLLGPESDTLRLPPPTDAPVITTPTPFPGKDRVVNPAPDTEDDVPPALTADPVGDHDCGPECYDQHKPPRPTKR